jgi:hypothetical protein
MVFDPRPGAFRLDFSPISQRLVYHASVPPVLRIFVLVLIALAVAAVFNGIFWLFFTYLRGVI